MSQPKSRSKINQPNPKRPRRMRREYGIGDFLSYITGPQGLVASAKKVAREEQLMINFDPAGKPVN
jgi:hypothetical protein